MKKQKGMTLIEMLVTLVIAAILMGYAVPSMRDFYLQQSIKNKANDILVDFSFARTEAINRGTPVRISPTTGWKDGWEIATDFNSNGTIDGNDELIRVGNLEAANITFTGSTDPVIFKGTGTLNSNAPRTITLKHTEVNTTKTLTVALSGSTSVN